MMTPASQHEPLLYVKDLSIDFQTEAGMVRAVDEISFTVHRGEIVGLVGESGAGKSLTSEAILRLIRCPPGVLSGQILYRGTDLLTLKEAELAGGNRLVGVGARLVGEVFLALLSLDEDSYLSQRNRWRPTLPSRTRGTFTMVDLLTFAGVDPASRQQ